MTGFMQDLSTAHPLLWALFVVSAVASAGVLLFFLWEVVLRVPFRKKTAEEEDRPPQA